MHQLQIRPARASDLGAINGIYNHYVEHSTCTFQEEPVSEADRAAWFAEHDEAHPVIVVERDGEVVAWGSLSRFHSRAAYRHTVEPSVYVRHDLLARGIGKAILSELVTLARAAGHHAIVTLICTETVASIALAESLGFVQVGHLREVGFKAGRWLDVVYVQLVL